MEGREEALVQAKENHQLLQEKIRNERQHGGLIVFPLMNKHICEYGQIIQTERQLSVDSNNKSIHVNQLYSSTVPATELSTVHVCK